MSKSPNAVAIPGLVLEGRSPLPMYRRIYDGIRALVLDGRLQPGQALPSSRSLAAERGISRNTVVAAFEQLAAEGFLVTRVGDATRVAPGRKGGAPSHGSTHPRIGRRPRFSRRGAPLAAAVVSLPASIGRWRAFRAGVPALDAFPYALWARLSAARWRRADRSLAAYGDPAGYRPLREAVAAYLSSARAVRCIADQVVIVSGSQQALDLIVRLLLDAGDHAWIEDPGYLGARAALLGAGVTAVPVRVDGDGFDPAAALRAHSGARLAYVTPSHQYPTGAVMSVARRLALLAWARRARGWIIEDDYDGEFRYRGKPLASLQGLDDDGRVIYVGTFSKVLLPGLRLGYVVAPPELAAGLIRAKAVSDRHCAGIDQAVVADFITQGHFARHLRRMRELYQERQGTLVAAAEKDLSGLLEIASSPAGMHVVGYTARGIDDRLAAAAAAREGVETSALSSFRMTRRGPGGLVLGYAQAAPAEIESGVRSLRAALIEAESSTRSQKHIMKSR
ncbi:MAG TPA: PLP-dependent aminotransferase family protein [Candidatus Eremiobacteraceae bacterium]